MHDGALDEEYDDEDPYGGNSVEDEEFEDDYDFARNDFGGSEYDAFSEQQHEQVAQQAQPQQGSEEQQSLMEQAREKNAEKAAEKKKAMTPVEFEELLNSWERWVKIPKVRTWVNKVSLKIHKVLTVKTSGLIWVLAIIKPKWVHDPLGCIIDVIKNSTVITAIMDFVMAIKIVLKIEPIQALLKKIRAIADKYNKAKRAIKRGAMRTAARARRTGRRAARNIRNLPGNVTAGANRMRANIASAPSRARAGVQRGYENAKSAVRRRLPVGARPALASAGAKSQAEKMGMEMSPYEKMKQQRRDAVEAKKADRLSGGETVGSKLAANDKLASKGIAEAKQAEKMGKSLDEYRTMKQERLGKVAADKEHRENYGTRTGNNDMIAAQRIKENNQPGYLDRAKTAIKEAPQKLVDKVDKGIENATNKIHDKVEQAKHDISSPQALAAARLRSQGEYSDTKTLKEQRLAAMQAESHAPNEFQTASLSEQVQDSDMQTKLAVEGAPPPPLQERDDLDDRIKSSDGGDPIPAT